MIRSFMGCTTIALSTNSLRIEVKESFGLLHMKGIAEIITYLKSNKKK